MTEDLSVPTWLALLALAGLLVLVVGLLLLLRAGRRARRRTDERLAAAARDTEALRTELAVLAERLDPDASVAAPRPGSTVAVPAEAEYVITRLGAEDGAGEGAGGGAAVSTRTQPRPGAPAPVVPAPVFVDIVLRESVIKTAALAAGVRRALAPEVRNRIRHEMKREVKRSRKERRTMLKAARRDWESRRRIQDDTIEVTP